MSGAAASMQHAGPPAAVVVFARYPVPGKTKTRLAASVGAGAAAEFYKACAEHTFAEVHRCSTVMLACLGRCTLQCRSGIGNSKACNDAARRCDAATLKQVHCSSAQEVHLVEEWLGANRTVGTTCAT